MYGLAGDASDTLVSVKLRAFRQFLLLYGAARSWLWVKLILFEAPLLPVSAVVMTVGFALTLSPRSAYLGPRVALPAMLYQVALVFPNTANHNFLELYALALLCLLGHDETPDLQWVLGGLKWLTVVVLFHTGFQKLAHGYYLRGDFLAFMVGAQERFAHLFAVMLPAEEITRLQSYDYLRTGSGPFRVSRPLFVAASNAVWIAELTLPVFVVWRRTRTWATLLAVGLIVMIQLGALEIGFAILFVNLLLLFLPGNWNRRLLPLFAFVLVIAALAGLLGLPILTAANI